MCAKNFILVTGEERKLAGTALTAHEPAHASPRIRAGLVGIAPLPSLKDDAQRVNLKG